MLTSSIRSTSAGRVAGCDGRVARICRSARAQQGDRAAARRSARTALNRAAATADRPGEEVPSPCSGELDGLATELDVGAASAPVARGCDAHAVACSQHESYHRATARLMPLSVEQEIRRSGEIHFDTETLRHRVSVAAHRFRGPRTTDRNDKTNGIEISRAADNLIFCIRSLSTFQCADAARRRCVQTRALLIS